MAKIADTLKLDQAFALTGPRRVAQVLREDRMDAYAAREAIREAAARQGPDWQAEFWQEIRRHQIDI